ncbi:metal ABC transporter substrate-binding protein [Enemella sp. A6]|uniref:metal ABC transporter substrate-binding protein n=1 Tax=Enemella sp. A6 TaxID=3440152 RepID=UPI003EB8A821
MSPPPTSAPRAALAALLCAVLALGAVGCSDRADNEVLRIFATTGYLADAAQNIAPEAEVITMVGPGGDPHTYQPSTRDIQRIQDADVVLWNGFRLEAHLVDQLRSLGRKQLAAAEQLPDDVLLSLPETDEQGEPLRDPHVWNNPHAWVLVIDYIADKLAEIDPDRAEQYRANAAEYRTEIEATAEEVDRLLAGLPEPRMLVTGHDAFNYLGDTYHLTVHATDFISSDAVLSPEELSRLADLIADHEVPMIFQDNQANPQAIKSLREAVRARGWEVRISDQELYADSLGAEPGVDTYSGVLLHNATAIADALGTEKS